MAGFTPVEEVDSISMGPREMGERVVRDFFREGWVGDHSITMSIVDLADLAEQGGAQGFGGGGGGGGYSGGGSGRYHPDSCGGGGGSFNVGNNQQNECCYNKAGHGQVTITLL